MKTIDSIELHKAKLVRFPCGFVTTTCNGCHSTLYNKWVFGHKAYKKALKEASEAGKKHLSEYEDLGCKSYKVKML